MDTVYFIITYTLFSAIPIMITALGGLFSERGGVVNIALEGLMVLGALFGFIVLIPLQATNMNPHLALLIAIIAAGVAGGVFSLIHSFAAVNLKADQVISGTAINLFSVAFAVIMARQQFGRQQIEFNKNAFFINKVPVLGDIPFIGDILFQNVNIGLYVGIAILAIATTVLYKTRFGLRLRACGEHPQAAASAGINVYFIRYMAVTISGVLAGIGGLLLIASTAVQFDTAYGVNGFGFLSLAVLIFGQWKPLRVAGAALIFGLFYTVASASDSFAILANSGIQGEWFSMLPYILTLLVLVLTSNNSQGPRAAGEPYDEGKR